MNHQFSIDYSKSPDWVSIEGRDKILVHEPPKSGSFDVTLNWSGDAIEYIGAYFGSLPGTIDSESFSQDYTFKVDVSKVSKKVTLSQGTKKLSDVQFKFSEDIFYNFNTTAKKKFSQNSEVLTVKTVFKKDLGFSYSVKKTEAGFVSFSTAFDNIGNYGSKDYISFAFKDSVEVLAKNMDPGKTLDGKTFKVYIKDLIKNSREAGEKTGLEVDEESEKEEEEKPQEPEEEI